MKNLIKKREGMVPERRWLEVERRFLGWLVWKGPEGWGWEGDEWGEMGFLRSIHQSKKLSYFKISFGGWTVFFVRHRVRKLFNTQTSYLSLTS